MRKKTVIHIHPDYEFLRGNIEAIPHKFLQEGKLIRDKRNHLREVQYQGIDLCVKSFKKPQPFNQIMYSFFRMGKAQRSYKYALRLKEYKINTPSPIAYIEQYSRWGLLTHSYYICEYEAHFMRIGDINKMAFSQPKKEAIIGQFIAEVEDKLHHNGIVNKDFNGSNVLVSEKNGQYRFSFVDINRIRFKQKLTHRDELMQLNMISDDPEVLMMIAQAYAQTKQLKSRDTTYELFTSKYLKKRIHRQQKAVKNMVKHLIHPWLWLAQKKTQQMA